MGLVSHPVSHPNCSIPQDYLEGDPTSDRPKDVTTLETATAVLQLIQENYQSIYKQIQESLGITAWAAENILHEQLHACKLCTVFLPHRLTNKQKSAGVQWC
ncbi:hypothetical protein ILUMI_17440 [Ignelater luminosus]|uniref:Uncharacterized protein n=1 Tax=Ignelater luminosus TaxID=2038154 RepID=A0A8K0G7X2_IGNLU|nr:hypothetical protein ILUMI_17440 [Ignelater luminosus]